MRTENRNQKMVITNKKGELQLKLAKSQLIH